MKAKRLQWDNSTDAATAEGVLGTYAIYEPGHWGSQWLQDNSAMCRQVKKRFFE